MEKSREEKFYISYIKQADMNFDVDMPIPEMTLEQIIKEFDTPHSRIWMFLELTGIAHIDREFAAEERQLLSDVAKNFKLKDETIQALTDVVLQHKKQKDQLDLIIKDYFRDLKSQ